MITVKFIPNDKRRAVLTCTFTPEHFAAWVKAQQARPTGTYEIVQEAV